MGLYSLKCRICGKPIPPIILVRLPKEGECEEHGEFHGYFREIEQLKKSKEKSHEAYCKLDSSMDKLKLTLIKQKEEIQHLKELTNTLIKDKNNIHLKHQTLKNKLTRLLKYE